MQDRYCRVCFEPWSEPQLDMCKWEYKLFKQGAGCTCCEGRRKEGDWEPPDNELGKYIYNGDGDPIDTLNVFETPYDKRPKWERPKDPILWTCAACGVEVIRNVDDGKLEYRVPYGSKADGWYISHNFRDMKPKDTPSHVFKPDQPVCENCYQVCRACGEPVCSLLEYRDIYNDGWCSTLPNYGHQVGDVFCRGCVESSCPDCGNLADDCKCFECSECMNMCKVEDKSSEDAGMCQECYDELYKNSDDEDENNE